MPAKKIGYPVFDSMSEKERRSYVEFESKRFNNSDRNKAQSPKNCIYTGSQFEDNIDVLVINSDTDIHINVNKMNPEKTSAVHVKYLNIPKFCEAAQEFSERVDYSITGKCRKCPEGNMLPFGVRLGSGMHKIFEYARTKKNARGINHFHMIMNILIKEIIQECFPAAYKVITSFIELSGGYVPEELGGTLGFCCQMIVSNNLGCEAHVDQDLVERCVSVWTTGKGRTEDPEGSFFILPYLTCEHNGKQYKGIAIKLRQGCAIEWDGRHIFHASSSPSDPNAIINGNWFGVTR